MAIGTGSCDCLNKDSTSFARSPPIVPTIANVPDLFSRCLVKGSTTSHYVRPGV